ncbi:MAG: hypothetical protein IPK73_29020 [Candidatus Obscuribacter sp.]|nr:hypothetical protein [Candidatus Obscuribacter sp.]
MAAIKVRATQSRAGMILMNSNLGTIFLPTGTLNVNGDMTNNQGAGMIILLAKTLDVQPGTIISNNQSETAPGMGHQIFICVEKVKYRGDGTNGLKILNDGNGYPGYFSLVNISPQGYLVPTGLTSDVNRMPWNFTFSSAELAKDGPLTIDGVEGNAQIVLRSDGNTAAVNVSGYPLAFNGGDVTVRSRGQTLHRINVGFFGTVNGTRPGLTVNNVGNWVLDANGQAPASGGPAAGGIIQVKADQTSLTALDSVTDPSSGNIVIRANGADSAGDGGIISVDTKSFVLGATTHAAIRADGAPNGTGNAVKNPLDSAGPFAVLLKIGSSDLILGGGNRAIRISANGGGVSGNGGTVKVEPSAKIKVRDSLAVDASVSSDDSDGGIIGLLSSEVTFVGANLVDPQTAIRAKAGANGNGGEITVNHTPDQFDRIAILDGTQSDGTPAIAARQNLAPKKGELVDVNGVPCRDYPDPSIVWPSHYRLCTFTRESPNAIDLAPLNLAKSAALDGIRNLFAQKRVSIYVFTDGSYHNTAFNDLADLRHGSYTLNIRGGGRAYVSIWQKGSIGQTTSTPPNYNQFQVTEVAAHEFGHAVGVSRSDDDVSTTDVYKTYIARDGYDLDWLTIPGTQTKVRRDPCAPTSYQLNGQTVVSAAKPPFEGVVDLNRGNQAVCVADENGNPVLAADYASAQDNQTILTVLIENSIWGSFAEVHAQSFGHNLVGNQGARPMTDKVFDNSKGITLDDSYFVCSRAWAEAERLGNPKPNPDTLSPSGSCSVAP